MFRNVLLFFLGWLFFFFSFSNIQLFSVSFLHVTQFLICSFYFIPVVIFCTKLKCISLWTVYDVFRTNWSQQLFKSFICLSFGSSSFTWLSFGSLHASLPPLWLFLASVFWVHGPSSFCVPPQGCSHQSVLPCRPHAGHAGTCHRLALEALCKPHKLKDCFVECPVFQGKLQSAALFGPFAMVAVAAELPTSVTLFWKGKLLPSSGFGKVVPFPGRSSNIKGAFCNETEPEKSFIKVSMSLTPCAQEQVFWLLHSYPCQHW